MDTQETVTKCGIRILTRYTRVGTWCFCRECFFERPDGLFNSIVRAIPELEEVEASVEAETEDDMELEELIVEAQMNETVEDQLTDQLARKDDDCQVLVRSPITG